MNIRKFMENYVSSRWKMTGKRIVWTLLTLAHTLMTEMGGKELIIRRYGSDGLEVWLDGKNIIHGSRSDHNSKTPYIDTFTKCEGNA